MQGIIDYERKHHIPDSWINYAIRYSSPNGHWQRLERGEIKMDADFFTGFTADLHKKSAWKEFNSSFRNQKHKLKDVSNPTQLGDPVSLKAEPADSSPTDQDRGSASSSPNSPSTSPSSHSQNRDSSERPSLSKLAKDTTIGDPVSLESEEVAISSPSKEKENVTETRADTMPDKPASSTSDNPPLIDGEALFWTMMDASRQPDPYVFPALERLRGQSPRPIIAALSNTVIFPSDHPYAKEERSSSASKSSNKVDQVLFNPKTFFDVYVASAEVGMRKPSRDIYELAIRKISDYADKNGQGSITPEDVVFLDDIGENLRMGKEVGMRTIRVQLGKTWRAVKELEGVLGTELMDEKTRRSKL